jgi:hypothetical protein
VHDVDRDVVERRPPRGRRNPEERSSCVPGIVKRVITLSPLELVEGVMQQRLLAVAPRQVTGEALAAILRE